MRLFVNGVEVPVRNRLEVLMDLADEGEDLPPDATIRIRGGSLRIVAGADAPGLLIEVDRAIVLNYDESNPSSYSIAIENADKTLPPIGSLPLSRGNPVF